MRNFFRLVVFVSMLGFSTGAGATDCKPTTTKYDKDLYATCQAKPDTAGCRELLDAYNPDGTPKAGVGK